MKKIVLLLICFVLYAITSFSQITSVSEFKPEYLNWYNLDLKSDGVLGASVDKAYKELLQDKKPKKVVVVAVIDGGVDINNEDLKGKIWVNEKEVPGNNIDDDQNGYVDDIHGWNFIGNSKGQNINLENLEYTRIYKLGPNDKDYPKAKLLYEAELAKRLKDKETYAKFEERYLEAKKIIKDNEGINVTKMEDLLLISSKQKDVVDAVAFLKGRYKNGFTEESFLNRKKRNALYLESYLNLKFNPRELIGDNPDVLNDMRYGNGDVKGPRASHGTCVAGIIAGNRNNGIGIDGIASEVKIMVLRVVPDGDERDKDIALAIRYAVDNGADILNMSFGKPFSPHQGFVSDAIKYAEQKNVLIIHAAGNEAENVDEIPHYPSDMYMDQTEASNFINVGASGKEKSVSMACIFSNYGQVHVDVFAPGEDIIALDTNNTFEVHSGTSQATPVVTGIAATILSYYPGLKPQDLIAILLESTSDFKKQKVEIPDLINDKRKVVKFKTLSKSGGIVNLYNAIKKAEKY